MSAFIVTPPKSLDACTIGEARRVLREAVTRHPSVTVDLEAVEFMDSYGLGMLVGALRVAKAHDCEMTAVCTSEPILKLFRLTGMDRVLDIRPSLEACRG